MIPTGPLRGLPKTRPTDKERFLTIPQACNLVNAVAFAERIGKPLNRRLDIQWNTFAGFSNDTLPALQTTFFKRLQGYLERRGIETAYVWTRERAPAKGIHTHSMLNLSPRLIPDLKSYLESSLEIGPYGLRFEAAPMNTSKMRFGSLRYMLKGIDHGAFRYVGTEGETENLGQALGIDHRGTQGIIPFKRAGASQNIAQKARKAASYVDVTALEELHLILRSDPATA